MAGEQNILFTIFLNKKAFSTILMQVIEEPEELAEDLCEARCSDLEQRRADRYFHIWDLVIMYLVFVLVLVFGGEVIMSREWQTDQLPPFFHLQ